MTQSELKHKMFDLVQLYFGSAILSWGKVKLVSPNAPQVVLTMLPVVRKYHPITQTTEGIPVNSWSSKTTLQVDLYTKGNSTNSEANIKAAKENTAVNDLSAFLNFLGSAYVDNWSLENDISIHANQVLDLTEITNVTTWEYRAMVELELGFTESAVGFTGMNYEKGMAYWGNGRPKYDKDGNPIDPDGNPMEGLPGPLPFTPSPSGGGTQDLADSFIGWFEKVDGPEFEKR